MKLLKITTCLVAGLSGAAVLAHSGATGIVKERMEGMMAMGDAVEAVTPMMRGEEAFDAERLREAARTFAAHSGEEITSRFPEGSTEAPSEAKDEIWEDWDRFAALAEQLKTSAEGLEQAAGNGLSGAGGHMSGESMMGDAGSMMGDTGSMMGGGSSMMGGSTAMGSGMSAEHIAQMPADAAFEMTTQVCSTCHTRFREDTD
jgi:cytochrome c556